MSQAVTFGQHPTTGISQPVKTDGNGRMQVTVTYGAGASSPAFIADNADAVAASSTADKQAVASRQYVFNGTTWGRQRGDTSGAYFVRVLTSAAPGGVVPVVNQNAFSLLLKASAGNFVGGYILAGATAGFLIAYNAVAAPAAGAGLTANLILGVVPVAANSPASLGDYDVPERFGTGIVLLFSTSLTTFTQPANPALFMKGKAA